MRLIYFFSFALFLSTLITGCSADQNKEHPADSLKSSVPVPGDSIINLSKEIFAGQPISFYLAHPQIPVIAKDLYTKKVQISDEERILALMDSVFTTNDETAPFYFLVITQTMEKADGSYSEPLGMMAKEYVETNTMQFLDYFLNEPLLTAQNSEEWSRNVGYEIMIANESDELNAFATMEKEMRKNCNECSYREKEKLNEFLVEVKAVIEKSR
ncbi:MAG: hypothetical protein ABIQ40_19675 [Bacteroidia bacterium]